MKTMHLFSGGGGGLLADLILGHEPVVAVEWEPYACQILRERCEDGWFPGMQVWEGDVRLFNPSEYKGRVDCIHAGFPCQDISNAGNKAGIGDGTRSGLYREVLRIADVVRPEFIFLENVSAIVTGNDGEWLRTIIGDLAERGYLSQWTCVSAAEVGAKHKRDRWWLLAYTDSKRESSGLGQVQSENGEVSERNNYAESGDAGCDRAEDVAYADSKGLQRWEKARNTSEVWARRDEQPKRCSDSEGYARKAESSLGRVVDDVSNRMDWNSCEAEVGRVTDQTKDRAKQLKALGNGQVPLQAAVAFSVLKQIADSKIDA